MRTIYFYPSVVSIVALSLVSACGSQAFVEAATSLEDPQPPAPPPDPPPPPSPPSPQPLPSGGCYIQVQVSGTSGEGEAYEGTLSLRIRNPQQSQVKVPWVFTIRNAAYTETVDATNWRITGINGGNITGVIEDPANELHPAAPVTLGLTVRASKPSLVPSWAAVNDTVCEFE